MRKGLAIAVTLLLGASSLRAFGQDGSPCCTRTEPISDPVAPEPAPPMRYTFDFGAGMYLDREPRARFALAYGAAFDWHFALPFAAGVRLGYVGTTGEATDLFDPGLRLRWRLGGGHVRGEIEAATLARLSFREVGHSGVGVGGGAVLYLEQLGFGVRYERTLVKEGSADTFLFTIERATKLERDDDGRAWSDHGTRLPRIGLGLHVLGPGWGFARGLGIALPGVALELPVSFGGQLLPVVRWDFMSFPGIDGPALTTQSALLGVQWYRFGTSRLGASALGGYTLTYGDAPRVAEAGPIADAGIFYWLDDLGFHLGLHGRAGLTEADRALRVVYFSLGGRQIF